MKKLILIVSMLVISALVSHADVYVKQKTSMGEFMGQPARDTISEQWMGTDKMAVISQDSTMITDLAAKKMFLVNHKNKTYIETGLPLDMTRLMPEQAAEMMKGMLEGMTITFQANGQTKKILDWDAIGYDVKISMMGMEMKMIFWASADVPFDWKKFTGLYAELYKAQFRMGEKFMKEFNNIKGFPVATEVEVMGMKMSSTTLEISQKTPGPDIYSVPRDYIRKEKLSIEDLQSR